VTPNPVVFIDDRWLYSQKCHVPEEMYEIPLGKAVVRKEGKDISLISSSWTAVLSMQAAEKLEAIGISAEVIDLRCLKPFDEELILASVEKTGRAVVIDGSWKTGGIHAEYAALISEKCFGKLKSAVTRITLPDAPAPAAKSLEKEYYITVEDIVERVKGMMN
jgi:acetoin:2,6-dichlorophenolindophenol oxidoreductase subunit beta